MDEWHIVLLIAAGIAGGVLSAVVGGASLVTYPALIATGVHPIAASVCTNAALTPSNMLAALSDRSQLPPFDRNFITLILMSILGAAAGAILLLSTPPRLFELLVPLLLGFATVMFALSERIARWLRERSIRQGRDISVAPSSLKLLLPVSFYGGYFGSGAGILVLGVMSVVYGGNYRAANVVKNLIGGLNVFAATCVYVSQGAVLWQPTIALGAGTITGGLIGAWVARILPRRIVRVLVVLFGAALTLMFVYRFWIRG